jgi:hypothetical protein
MGVSPIWSPGLEAQQLANQEVSITINSAVPTSNEAACHTGGLCSP